jgi:hypothetical protein
MPKVSDEPLLRVHIQLYKSDWDFLFACFGSSVKRSAVVRDVVRGFVRHTRAKAEGRAGHVPAAAATTTEASDGTGK